jgi:hypothetical protein
MGWNTARLPCRSYDTDPLHFLQMGAQDPSQEQICSNNLVREPGGAGRWREAGVIGGISTENPFVWDFPLAIGATGRGPFDFEAPLQG